MHFPNREREAPPQIQPGQKKSSMRWHHECNSITGRIFSSEFETTPSIDFVRGDDQTESAQPYILIRFCAVSYHDHADPFHWTTFSFSPKEMPRARVIGAPFCLSLTPVTFWHDTCNDVAPPASSVESHSAGCCPGMQGRNAVRTPCHSEPRNRTAVSLQEKKGKKKRSEISEGKSFLSVFWASWAGPVVACACEECE